MNLSSDGAPISSVQQRMVNSQLRARGISDVRVLDSMLRVPRHEFAPPNYRDQAYDDHPLPIGAGQTISQPYIVARMLEALALLPGDRVLEVGTGSGYVTALLAELSSQVFSVERHAALAAGAEGVLARLGYSNVRVIVSDGRQGFAEGAPYDAIIVSAAAAEVPPALLAQLAEGGRMIIPVGPADTQQLQLIRKQNGQGLTTFYDLCRFVPLVSEAVK